MTTFVDLHRSDFNLAAEMNVTPLDADILWRDHAGDNVLWLGFGVATLPFVTPDWHVKAATNFGAFTFDPGILWQNDNGALALWQMNATLATAQVTAVTALPNPGPTWHVVGDNDFNLDQADDILFQNDNGAVAMWTITAATGNITGMFAGTQNPGPAWHVVATGDLDGDGKAGILWQNDNGALAVWEHPSFVAGTFTFNALPLQTVDPSWHVKGMADLKGDGGEDIVFQNDNGAVVVWDSQPGAFLDFVIVKELINLNPGPSWHVAGLRDMNGDGHADILFQNDNGAAAVWEKYQDLGVGSATFATVLAIDPNPNPNGHVWDLL